MPRLHTLHTAMTLARPRAEVFAFFAAAENLGRITPPELQFSILDAPAGGIAEGAILRYRLRLAGVPFGWTTEISRWQPDRLFVDEQRRGPYAVWHHTHRFTDVTLPDGTPGTHIDDTVLWALPLAPLGEVVAPLVRWQLARVFAYRERAIREILAGG